MTDLTAADGSRAEAADPRVAQLREMLQGRRQPAGDTDGNAGPAPIVPAGHAGLVPLSYGQQRLWFLHRLDPSSGEYAVPLLLRLTGELDVPALNRSLSELVRRHESLRTRYVARPDGQFQEVMEPHPLDLRSTDLSGTELSGTDLSGTGLPGQATERVAALLAEPFDLAAGDLCHALLLRLAPQDHILALSLHHICCDGWSLSVLRRELSALYPAFAGPEPVTGDGPAGVLPPSRLQYADFARWQREQLGGAELNRQLAYWRERLDGLEPMELPTDRPRPAMRDPRGASVTFHVPAETGRAVLELGRQNRATPFMTLLAAVFTVLGKHARQDRPVIGTPVAGRNRAEVEDVVGFFVNTMVCRGDLSGDPTVTELLARVRDGSRADYAHQDLPFERLVDDLAPDRHLSRTPLVQVSLVVDQPGPAGGQLGDLQTRELGPPTATAKFDLTIGIEIHPDGSLAGVIEYATALFDADRAARLSEHLVRVLAQMAARPGHRLSELEMLTDHERELLFRRWNDTATPYAQAGRCLHELVTEQAHRVPDAVAVRCAEAQLSYAELERRANQLSHRLRELGVGLETPVAVLCERSLNLLPALLAILKAGGHYVPLDLASPPDRLAFMMAEAGVPVVLTTAAQRGKLPDFDGRVIVLDDPALELERYPAEPVPVTVSDENLAYITYTSGSTGRPKGVMIPHRGVVHYLAWCAQAYRASEGDGAPVHSSLSFDLTVTGLFLPLMCGTTVTLIPEDDHPVTGLAAALASGRVFSFVKLTPAHLELLQKCLGDSASAASAASFLVVGGEQLTPSALQFWREHAPEVMVSNEYGHTETSVANVMNVLPAGAATRSPVPVGHPIWNTTVYLVDEQLQPVPVGVTGELLAGGVGVARGFVGRPGLTAERYIPNPFGPGRLYRSGDLLRYLPDGTLEFVGRTDHQVKVRGYRIELGEIESSLLSHPAVTECVVIVWADASGTDVLVGYVAASGPERPTPEALRQYLAERLPGYMIPSFLTVLDHLPLTQNGKIDRAALPAATAGDAARVPPRDRLELAVTRIWEEVLDRRPIGVTEDFFAVGGHSLIAVTLVERLRDELGLDAGLLTVFRMPTVRQMCEELRATAGDAGAGLSASGDCVLPLSPGSPGEAPLFLVPPTAGNPFPYLPLVDRLKLSQPIYALQSVGYETAEEPLTTIEEIARRYLRDMERLPPGGVPCLVGWSFGGSVAYEMARQLEAAGRPVGQLCVIDASVLGSDRIELPEEVSQGDALGLFGRTMLDLAPEQRPGLTEEQAREELLAQARSRDLIPQVAGTAMIDRMAAVYLANSRATMNYQATAVLRCDIHLIKSTERHPEHGGPEVRAESWAAMTRGRLSVTEIPGNHWSIVEPPFVDELARAIMAGLRA